MPSELNVIVEVVAGPCVPLALFALKPTAEPVARTKADAAVTVPTERGESVSASTHTAWLVLSTIVQDAEMITEGDVWVCTRW